MLSHHRHRLLLGSKSWTFCGVRSGQSLNLRLCAMARWDGTDRLTFDSGCSFCPRSRVFSCNESNTVTRLHNHTWPLPRTHPVVAGPPVPACAVYAPGGAAHSTNSHIRQRHTRVQEDRSQQPSRPGMPGQLAVHVIAALRLRLAARARAPSGATLRRPRTCSSKKTARVDDVEPPDPRAASAGWCGLGGGGDGLLGASRPPRAVAPSPGSR